MEELDFTGGERLAVAPALEDCFWDIATYFDLHKVGVQSRSSDIKRATPHKTCLWFITIPSEKLHSEDSANNSGSIYKINGTSKTFPIPGMRPSVTTSKNRETFYPDNENLFY